MNIVFDLDGTLADCRHRVHFVTGEEKNWDSFYAACGSDDPIWPIVYAFKACLVAGHRVEIWSGRREDMRSTTYVWFKRHGISLEGVAALRMRPKDDHSEDCDLKRSWLKAAMAADQKPDLVFEDRQQVVDMYRAEGILVAQVAEGKF